MRDEGDRAQECSGGGPRLNGKLGLASELIEGQGDSSPIRKGDSYGGLQQRLNILEYLSLLWP